MQLYASTKLKQRQGLTITVQLQQAIKLLQLNNIELAKYIEEQAQENPFLEVESSQNDRTHVDNLTQTAADKVDHKVSIENQFETGDPYSTRRSGKNFELHEEDNLSNSLKAEETSLFEHITQFAFAKFENQKDLRVALAICEEIEPSGWLNTELEMIAVKVNTDIETVSQILQKLQTIEPTGLFARNLRECLTLQLEDKKLLTDDIMGVILELDKLAKGNLETLKKTLNIGDKRMLEIISTIRSLNPKPGALFAGNNDPITTPDLKIVSKNNTWTVSLYSGNLPTLSVNKDYAKEAIATCLSSRNKDFLKNYLSDAHWLKRAIHQRNETTLKIGMSILKFQMSFFEKGPAYLCPLTLKEISEDVGVHESTVSRVTSNSLIETPYGVLPLRFFFSSKIKGTSDQITSGSSMRHKITQLIKSEDPNSPLSDEDLVEKFAADGVKIARRTVAKYRKMENIPSSFDRKKRAKLEGLVL